MRDDVRHHYERLLASHYTWMSGLSFAAKVAEQREVLRALGIVGTRGGLAVDLGCGPGYQSAALLDLGFERVVAVDGCAALLEELASHTRSRAIETVCDDLRTALAARPPGSAAAIVCVGDTLTHLDSLAEIERLVDDVHAALAPGGRCAFTYRDLTADVPDTQRVHLVRADATRVLTCVLDYEPDEVWINDLLHMRQLDGWTLEVGRYRKLRLAPALVRGMLEAAGFVVDVDRPQGHLHALAATRPR
jgi:SAM-dependent methyltransferase